MKTNHISKKIASILSLTLVAATFVSCGSMNAVKEVDLSELGLPNTSYTISEETNELSEIIDVNFYYDNIENTKCIDQTVHSNGSFLSALFTTNRGSFNTTDYCMSLEEGKYKIKQSDSALENLYKNDSFYISSSSVEARENNPGILGLLYNEGSEFSVSPDDLTVVFTDLSEKHIYDVASSIREKYIEKTDYNVCLMTVNLNLKSDMGKFYISSVNDKVVEVSESKVKDLTYRSYYVLMAGPTTKLSTYMYNLKANLKNNGCVEGNHYNVSEYNFYEYNFNQETDLNSVLVSGNDYADENNGMYENYSVRLAEKQESALERAVRPLVEELSYSKNLTGKSSLQGYKTSYSKDFSYHGKLDINIKGETVKYNTIRTYDEEEVKIRADELHYALGTNVSVHYLNNGEWVEMSEDRKDRYFNVLNTDGGELTVISDNTDEEGIKTVFVSVPVYQVLAKNNFTPDWVDGLAYNGAENYDGGTAPYYKTYNLRHFYCMLFDIDIENKKDDIYSTKTKLALGRVGWVRILIDKL